MATANISSEFFGFLNQLLNSSDPLGDIFGFSFDNADLLNELDLSGDGISAISASPSQIVVSIPNSAGSDFVATINGAGMGPLTSSEQFLAAISNGTATGTLDGISIAQDGTDVLALAFTPTGLTLESGAQAIQLTGTFPNQLAGLSSVLALTSILDPDSLADLTEQERNDLVTALSAVTMEGLTLTNGGTEVLAFDIMPTGVTLTTSAFLVELAGTMPSSVGGLVSELLTALDGGADILTGLFQALDVTGIRLADGAGTDLLVIDGAIDDLGSLELSIDGIPVAQDTDLLWEMGGSDVVLTAGDEAAFLMGTNGQDALTGGLGNDTAIGLDGLDTILGGDGDDLLRGMDGDDRVLGELGDDTIEGGDGNDTLNGGDGDDVINGGETDADLRDVILGGDGNDSLDGGYGNDLIYGQAGNDTLAGGFGADELQGQEGDDVVTGSALSDLVFGGDGNDFVNGGFGYDRINGGDGADRFFHLGVFDHGSDWVQDYTAADGDVLVFGQAATVDQFQINLAHTATPDGERSGDDDVQEAFVIYRPTGQIMWALVDGEGQDEINLQIGAETFDLLA
ncbi:calcium-binding protein [Lutimaribacter marinistellae]|uniref:Calcium-binding protein n=1 Tax=Lutimaribacter marinistellae TaxID=1820329 RepID=A0ABV7THS6_9RHOB